MLDPAARPPLTTYVIGVLIVWAVVLAAFWYFGGEARFKLVAIFCAGFLVGMLAMYIAVHLYRWQ